MTYIEKLWEKHSFYEEALQGRDMDFEDFQQAIQEAMQAQRDACAKTAINHLLSIDLRVSGLSYAILNAEVSDDNE